MPSLSIREAAAHPAMAARRTQRERRLPIGLGLMIAATASILLWAGIVAAVRLWLA